MGIPKITNKRKTLAAVKQFGPALEYVPEELITAELCLKAVKENGFALCFVPEGLRTAEICLEAERNNGKEKVFKDINEYKASLSVISLTNDEIEIIKAKFGETSDVKIKQIIYINREDHLIDQNTKFGFQYKWCDEPKVYFSKIFSSLYFCCRSTNFLVKLYCCRL